MIFIVLLISAIFLWGLFWSCFAIYLNERREGGQTQNDEKTKAVENG